MQLILKKILWYFLSHYIYVLMDFSPWNVYLSSAGNLCPWHLFDIEGLSTAINCDVMHGKIMRSKSTEGGIKNKKWETVNEKHKYLKVRYSKGIWNSSKIIAQLKNIQFEWWAFLKSQSFKSILNLSLYVNGGKNPKSDQDLSDK